MGTHTVEWTPLDTPNTSGSPWRRLGQKNVEVFGSAYSTLSTSSLIHLDISTHLWAFLDIS